jgi:hypothetical protein
MLTVGFSKSKITILARKTLRGTVSITNNRRADDGLRTRDLQLGKLALYQLSYVRASGYFSTPDVASSPEYTPRAVRESGLDAMSGTGQR